MEELELFKSRVEGYIEKCYTGGVSVLPFLDEAHLAIVKSATSKFHMDLQTYGGFINSDRVRVILSNSEAQKEDYKIVVYKIIYNKRYYQITHRSILGSLMGLGIKRECIGDIVITDSKDAYFACTKEISRFILDEFHAVGSTSIELEVCESEITHEVRYEEKVYFVASLRLDVILAVGYKVSRKEALEIISDSLVMVNHIPTQNPSKVLVLNDEISVRHKGRMKLKEIGGASKSGRIAVTLAKRV